jgi:hypothetical protein
VLVVQGAPITAVVRSSTGEAVILLSGNPLQQVPQTTLTDMLKAAAAVLNAAELHTINTVVTSLDTRPPNFHLHDDENKLTVYKLTVN